MWTNEQGNPIKTSSHTLQLELPDEKASAVSFMTINWMGVITAAIALAAALFTGNAAAIAAAIQSLINAILGK